MKKTTEPSLSHIVPVPAGFAQCMLPHSRMTHTWLRYFWGTRVSPVARAFRQQCRTHLCAPSAACAPRAVMRYMPASGTVQNWTRPVNSNAAAAVSVRGRYSDAGTFPPPGLLAGEGVPEEEPADDEEGGVD